MPHWTRVASLDQLPPGRTREIIAADRVIALANVEGQVFALDGVCPHQGGPLGEGRIEGSTLTCPWHGWQFNVCTGQHCLSQTIVQPSYPVRVEGGEIFVNLEDAVRP